jgi:hypothetical protein
MMVWREIQEALARGGNTTFDVQTQSDVAFFPSIDPDIAEVRDDG